MVQIIEVVKQRYKGASGVCSFKPPGSFPGISSFGHPSLAEQLLTLDSSDWHALLTRG